MSFFDKFWPKWTSRVKYACQVLFTGNVYFGRGDEWPGAPDFLFCCENINTSDDVYLWPSNGKPFVGGGLVAAQRGDAIDIIMRRAGPDGAKYNDQSPDQDSNSAIKSGTTIGAFYAQSWGGAQGGGNYWTPRNGHEGRMAGFRVRANGDQTATNRGGILQIFATPTGATDPTDVIVIKDNKVSVLLGGKMRTLKVDSKGYVKAS